MIRVWWYLSDWLGHRRAGQAYRCCLDLAGFQVVDSLDQADVAVVHEDPIFWPLIFKTHPLLHHKPTIGFAVWETKRLPLVYQPGLKMVHAVWTASHFSAAALIQGHNNVTVVPHIVEPTEPEDDDLRWVREHIPPDVPYFFCIVDGLNPRKNLDLLLRAFSRVRLQSGREILLVLKQYRQSLPIHTASVLSITDTLSDGRLAALHRLALGYVSPHRGEAWGLGLSEAMSHGVTVLGTGWSGNMEFMDLRNSVPLRYQLTPVGTKMSAMLPHYQPDMLWAEADEEHLVREMLRLVRRGPDSELCQRARAISKRFSAQRIARVIHDAVLRDMEIWVRTRG